MKEKNVNSEFHNLLQKATSGNNECIILLNQNLVDVISLEVAEKIYRDCIAKAGDFTFVLVGDFDG
ncbi:hypothetical protein [Zunongwangia sp.]|uniref:hypothetical protein n=1 Tax=Zunongwangia sp. TaxID=1965325 RepID=UPI003AA99722